MAPVEQRMARHISMAMRECREKRKWTQEDLAVQLKLSAHYVSMLERGLRLPSFAVLAKLSEVLGRPMGEVLGEPNEDLWLSEALDLLRVVPPKSRDTVAAMLRGVSGLATSDAVPGNSKKR